MKSRKNSSAVPDRTTGQSVPYRGRFAPSPTGPLHAGSIMAALASYLDARANNGSWLLRMEDLDPPRESPAAASRILHDLAALGLHWDGPVLYQSQRHAAYEAAIAQLAAAGHTFWCNCSRQALAEAGGHYPGTCRELGLPPGPGRALRCRVPDASIDFTDRWQGPQSQNLLQDTGDFIIKRKDGLHAYQLAVVIDDAWQGVTHVVRGIDLLDSTPRQIHLQGLLGLPTPHYAHIPVLVNAEGQKLSKQNHAPAIASDNPVRVLYQALARLQQEPDPQLLQADLDSLLDWALQHWQPARLTGLRALPDVSALTAPAV
jgi:glutamyl-Q tRNA(Asp) synthetase